MFKKVLDPGTAGGVSLPELNVFKFTSGGHATEPGFQISAMEESTEKAKLGLLPQLIAATWFALAASLPVGLFHLLFGSFSDRFEERWMFGVLPIVTAAYFGLTLGAKIFSTEIDGAGKAIGRGLLVAFVSYAALTVLVSIVITFPGGGSKELVNPVAALPVFGFGLVFVGWLVALAGGMAGWLLFRISRSLEQQLSGESLEIHGLKRRTSKVTNVTGLVLLLASTLPAGVSLRASHQAEMREKRNDELIAAASRGDVAAVRQLLEEGAEVEAGDNARWTSIIHATRSGQTEVVRVLLEHGADPNVVEYGNGNMTPLHWAATSNNIEGVKMLLEHHADINAATDYGYTPLMLASDNGTPQLVQVLLRYRPNLALRNNTGQTALELVQTNRDHTAIVDSANNDLRAAPATIKRARQRHDEIIRLLESAEARP